MMSFNFAMMWIIKKTNVVKAKNQVVLKIITTYKNKVETNIYPEQIQAYNFYSIAVRERDGHIFA